MRGVVQRVTQASVSVDDECVGQIQAGFVLLLGIEEGDDDQDLDYLLGKVLGLRVFPDDDGKMNLDLQQVGGELLVVSQFTLLGDVRKGRRPSFVKAASAELGREMYLKFVRKAKLQGLRVAEGVFQADMQVSLVNDGPVTLLLDSRKTF